MIAEIVLRECVWQTNKKFDYLVPDSLSDKIRVGQYVRVPFGRGNKSNVALILKLKESSDSKYTLKEIESLVEEEPVLNEEQLGLLRFLVNRYACTYGSAMHQMVPALVTKRTGRSQLVVSLVSTEKAMEALESEALDSIQQIRTLEWLLDVEEIALSDLMQELSISRSPIDTLAKKGLVQVRSVKFTAEEMQAKKEAEKAEVTLPEITEKHELNSEQQAAVDAVVEAKGRKEFLLYGVTGSGKTEVYLRAADYALRQGRQVLVLVPEIALTTQIVQRFQAWFHNEVAVVHSKLSQNERGDVWYKMRTGEANVLIGVRSAVFAPFKNLGLVIIDEEQENSYKQEERPAYHAREVARCRCNNNSAVLLLGSATPSLETYYRAVSGSIGHLQLTFRPGNSVLPAVDVVDMREELAQKNFSVISRKLRREIVAAVHAGQQAVVLLNRRGYSTFVMCRDCGETLTCPHCAVSLVYHADEQVMRCHYCGNTYPIPRTCPDCGSRRIKFFGSGTQKAEQEISQMPGVRVLRMDQDSTAAKLAHEEIIGRFVKKEANVLLGTQMVAKGHDIPDVTLVGILAADSALNLPDFRASERGFSLLIQAAGRAGRGDKPGRVVLQTYDPENEVINFAKKQDYETFAKRELAQRKVLLYPPYGQIIKLTVIDKNEKKAWELGDEVALFLRNRCEMEKWGRTEIMGPFPSGVAKVRDLYRINIVVKSMDMEKVKNCLSGSRFRTVKNIYFDVDPITAI